MFNGIINGIDIGYDFPEVITYIGLCRSADTGSWDAETAYRQLLEEWSIYVMQIAADLRPYTIHVM